MGTLNFKNLQLDTLTVRGEFRNWHLSFDEVSGKDAVTFAVDFLVEANDDLTALRPVALDPNSAGAIRMFFKNTEFASRVLSGFFKNQGVLVDVDWKDWAVRKTEVINF